MAIKVQFQSALTDLFKTSEIETGNIIDKRGDIRYTEDGKVYRFVKNVSATALKYHGACLKALTSVLSEINKNVRSTDTATAATAQLTVPAGVPVTAIGASGSSTGDHGWIQVKGPARVSMVMSDTASAGSGAAGLIAIATNLPATDVGWDVPEQLSADSANTAYIYVKGVRLAARLAEGTAGAARSAAVEIDCL